jgi:hypothetical protein
MGLDSVFVEEVQGSVCGYHFLIEPDNPFYVP